MLFRSNLADMFSQIETGTGNPVMQIEAGLGNADFLDILHLSDSGQVKFYDQLFRQLKRDDVQKAH